MADTTRIRFGLFDFDPATLELRRDGAAVKLQSQPGRVLALLLATPGEVVAREVMRQALWGDTTFVDFDRGLNFCIAQIRSALGDSADSPRYVKTLPRRGYQFIAPVSVPTAAAAPIPVPVSAPPRPTRRLAWLAIPAVAALAGALYFTLSPKPAIRIAVARFDNHTSDPAFDSFAETLADSFIAELTTTGANLAVIGNDPILRRSHTLRDVPAIGKALHVRFVLLGSIERNTAGINVFVQLIRLPDQAHVSVARLPTGEGSSLKPPASLAQTVVQRFLPRLT